MKFLTSLVLLSITLCSCSAPPSPKDAPNIIYILADDLGYGDISAYDPNGKIMTPNIDQLANSGIKFTDAHTTSSVCTPTRYSILTGRYSWRTKLKSGVLTGKSPALIGAEQSTVASMLKSSGYSTAAIGKWHLGWGWAVNEKGLGEGEGWNPGDFDGLDYSKPVSDSPNDVGFHYTYLLPASLDIAPYLYLVNGMATAIPDSVTVNRGKYSWWREGPTAPDFIHEETTPLFFRKANDYVVQQSGEEIPYFLYLPLPSPHTPILPSDKWQGKSNLNPYADFVMMIDEYVGELVNTVKSTGQYDNTIIIFTSDNGCSPAAKIGELVDKGHFPNSIYRGHKADIYEGGNRVPFIFSWPSIVTSGRTSDRLISTVDLMATLAELVDHTIADNEAVDSYSFLDEVYETAEPPRRTSLVMHSVNGSFAYRENEWKLIFCGGSGGWSEPRPNDSIALAKLPKFQLYNLKEDPTETNNLFIEGSERVIDMQTKFKDLVQNGRSTPGLPQKNDPGEKGWLQWSKLEL